MRLARYWGKDPDWFYTLDPEIQTSIIAEYQITNADKDTLESKQRKAKKAEITWKIKRQGVGVTWQRKR